MQSQAPVVSVCMSTYRHERYIKKAIEGVLMQRTGFPLELVIGEDESDDGTRAICEGMQHKYPERVRLLMNDKWYGQSNNLFRTIKACKGKYIALCEGDDYWTDPGKLQKQVDFLEANPDCVLCFHQIDSVDADNNVVEDATPANKITRYKGNDFFHIFIGTPSVVFRNCLHDFPPEFFKVKSTDAFLMGMLSGHGHGANLGFVGASYRKHDGGLYNRLNLLNRYKQSIHCRKMMYRSDYFTPEQKAHIKKELQRRERLYIKGFLKRFQLQNCMKMLFFILFE